MGKFKLSFLITLALLSTTSLAQVKINGAGATFPYPLYSKWFAEYNKQHPNILINYQSIGSGGGIRQLINQTVDFAASDAPMSEKEMQQTGGEVLHIPAIVGAVAIAYNFDEVPELKLDGPTLADIFLGKITKWSHPDIAKLNPNITLPARDILVIRRSDGSGTTDMFSDYLVKVSPEWEKKVGRGKALKWPTGLGAKGNEGVTGLLKQQPGSIGYIELAYAIKNNLKTVSLKNKSGKFVGPNVKSISASTAGIKNVREQITASLTNAEGDEVYPISGFTYLLIPVKKEGEKAKAIKDFLPWALKEGQAFAEELFYAPMPEAFAKELRDLVQEKL